MEPWLSTPGPLPAALVHVLNAINAGRSFAGTDGENGPSGFWESRVAIRSGPVPAGFGGVMDAQLHSDPTAPYGGALCIGHRVIL